MIRSERRRLLLLWLMSVGLSGILSAGLAVGWHVRHRHRQHLAEPQPPTNPVAQIAAWLETELSLTDEQRKGLAVLQADCQSDLREIDLRRSSAESAIAGALESARPGDPAVGTALESLSEAQAARQRAIVEHILAIRSLLTPGQSARFLRWTRDSLLHH